ncbi:MAG: MXAN_2562 family outer membrane beta-barrel protein, partial [Deltaproteobacteria bacterium]
ALGAAIGTLLSVHEASAQTFGYNDRRRFESPQNFAFELRGGPYVAAVDSEFTNVHPYQDIFGTPSAYATPSQRVLFGLSFEWQALRLWRIGQLGVGASLSYTAITEKAPFTSSMTGSTPATWTRGSEDTALSIIPATLHLSLRFDGLARAIQYIPIAPYIKAGLAYGLWWMTNGQGLVHVTNTQDAIGGSLGWHVALGAAVLLDSFEPRLARGWDQQQGVNHSYLFFEYDFTDLAGFSGRPQLNVGNTSTGGGANAAYGSWVLGLMLEF